MRNLIIVLLFWGGIAFMAYYPHIVEKLWIKLKFRLGILHRAKTSTQTPTVIFSKEGGDVGGDDNGNPTITTAEDDGRQKYQNMFWN